MNEFELQAQRRTETGTGAVRRLRRAGMVPGVVYGAGGEVQQLKVDQHYLRKQFENEAFFSHVLTLNIDGEPTQAVVKALQRDPTSQSVTHIDLLRVSSSSELTMHVPLHFINEELSAGKKAGGIVSHLMVDVEIACLPKDLPEYVEVDIGGLDIGEFIHMSQLTMPDGVRLTADTEDPDHDNPVVAIQHAQKLEVVAGEEVDAEVVDDDADA